MTASTGEVRRESMADRVSSFPLPSAQSLVTLVLVALMAVTVAWSIDDAAWVLGDPTYGDFLIYPAILATLVGFVGAQARWPRWLTHFVGACAAALVVPLFVGAILVPGASLPEMYRATAASMVNAWYDLAILNLAVTREIGHYLLVLGLLVWSVGQFASYAVFGHRRPLDAVIVVGMILLGNMALTPRDQLPLLVLFSVAALCVLARSHALDEETAWLRRRIGDASSVRSLYLRGGSVFIAGAVIGSLLLTGSASSAPLAGAWTGFSDKLIEISQSLQRYLPFGGPTRALGFGFGRTAPISGSWTPDNTLAATIHVPPGDTTHYYWRAVAYDRFEGQVWAWTASREINQTGGAPALLGQADNPDGLGLRTKVEFTVTPSGARNPFVLSPLDASSVDQGSTLFVVGADGYFSALGLAHPAQPYTVTALVPVNKDQAGGRTENRLRAAGGAYPPEVVTLYTAVPDGAMGPESTKLLADIVAKAGSRNPYDLAKTMESELKKFRYNQNVIGRCPPGQSVVECFATIKEGYCLYYASAMTIFMREMKIPARLVQGFLPGSRDTSGMETIVGSEAHAWVEVYFQGYGWQLFDPTGGNRSQNAPLPAGSAVPSATAAPASSSSAAARPSARFNDPGNPASGGTTRPPQAGGPALLIAVAILLLIAVGAVAFVAWQRGPRGVLSPESIWQSIGRTAARFGFGPMPTQTVYEYAGSLGQILPASRPELETVARAKVEVAYGRRELGEDRLGPLREASRRLRLNLLRLAFRRRERRERRRRRGRLG
jgi:transglutaminase-like putative cysteine protease